jgi:transposase InsO family protein
LPEDVSDPWGDSKDYLGLWNLIAGTIALLIIGCVTIAIGVIGVDEFRSLILLLGAYSWYNNTTTKFFQNQSPLLEAEVAPTCPTYMKFPNPDRRRQINHRKPSHRTASSFESEVDPREVYSQFTHLWIQRPECTYGSGFDHFCSQLHPLVGHRSSYKENYKDDNADLDMSWFVPPWFARLSSTTNHTLTQAERLMVRLLDKDFLTTTKFQSRHAMALIAAVQLQETGRSSHKSVYWSKAGDDSLPIVIDSGASVSITPRRSDFVGVIRPLPPGSTIQGLNHSIPIGGVGTIRWSIFDQAGVHCTFETTAYLIPSAGIRLFSPQVYFQENKGGELRMRWNETTLEMANGTILSFPFNEGNNLPMMLPSTLCKLHEKVFCFDLEAESLGISVSDETNQNITASQKELLGWHWKLGHIGFQWLQRLMRPRYPTTAGHRDDTGLLRPVLETRNSNARSCAHPQCAACHLGRQKRRNTGTSTTTHQHKEMTLKREHLRPGDCFSLDHYVSGTLGRLPHTAGKEKKEDRYTGGLIAVDHASGAIFVRHQISLRAGESLVAKHELERWASQFGVNIKRFHSDNGIFKSIEFLEDLRRHDQEIDFSGTGAHHQNGVAERSIQTVVEWARTMMIHAAIHWPDQIDLALWPFALTHAAHLYNQLPNEATGMSPLEIFTGQKVENHLHLRQSHVFGCPVYVLHPTLQDGKRIPKWVPRSRRGQFLGVSTKHASNIGLIKNIATGYVSPQFHTIYDDFFSTVANAGELADDVERVNLEDLIKVLGGVLENHLEDEVGEDGLPIRPPPIHVDWLTDNERRDHQNQNPLPLPAEPEPVELFLPPPDEDPNAPDAAPEGVDAAAPEGDVVPEGDITFDNNDDDDEPPPLGGRHPDEDSDNESDDDGDDPPPPDRQDLNVPEGIRRSRRKRANTKDGWLRDFDVNVSTKENKKVRIGDFHNSFLNSLDWETTTSKLKSTDFERFLACVEAHLDPVTEELDYWHPLLLMMKANALDNPNWHQATTGMDADGYWNAMDKELFTLNAKDAWDEVDRSPEMKVLPSTWAFKCKRFPDGLVKKLKARFCVRGDCQIDGVDVFDTYAPVVSWTTVRLLLVLSISLGLATSQVDYTAAFVQAKLPASDGEIFVEMPRGFSTGGKVLKLKRSLYGLRQSPKNFFDHLKERLEYCGFAQSMSDPCLFISDRVICLVYVDDCLFYSPAPSDIDVMIEKLRDAELDLEVESDVSGFLGVLIDRREDGSIELTQTGLTDRVITSMGLEGANIKKTPAEHTGLGADIAGEPCNETFSYPSVIGMLMYLASNSRPDIAFAVHQCARFTHNPRRSHEIALKRIGRYLLGTRKRGLIMKPRDDLKIDMYVDADFAGLWGVEDPNDPNCVKSRTGFVIVIGGCPVLWTSKLQTEIALSTMQAEYIALSMSMRDLLPFKDLVEEVCRHMGLDHKKLASIKTTVHEDNAGALTLANLPPSRVTPKSKHYGVKVHWFRSKLKPGRIEVVKIGTDDQLADIFTKGLRTTKFAEMRLKLLGW